MSLLMIVFFVIGGMGLRFFKFKRLSNSLLTMALLIFCITGTGLLPRMLLNSLQSQPRYNDPQWGNMNSIVVLGMGMVKRAQQPGFQPNPFGVSRILEAARLYFLCKQAARLCTLVPSGGDPLNNGTSEAQLIQESLIELGVDVQDIAIEAKANNTFMNAKLTSQMIKAKKFDQVLLVTSGYHLPRADLYFKHFGVNAIGSPSDTMQSKISWIPISLNFTLADLAVHEYVGMLRYFLYEYFGLNKKSE